MKQHQMLKNRAYAQGSMEVQLQGGRRDGGDNIAQGLSNPSWPNSLQPHQKAGVGMRAVFLGESAAKKERTGTGVFLPQRFGSFPPENRKKPGSYSIKTIDTYDISSVLVNRNIFILIQYTAGCPTVLLPERVVHALNSSRESIDVQFQQRSQGSFNTDYGILLIAHN